MLGYDGQYVGLTVEGLLQHGSGGGIEADAVACHVVLEITSHAISGKT